MKIDLSTILEMVEEEDKKIKENKAPVQPKQEKATLDLQGLFSLFEELEPTLKEDTSQQIPKDLEKNLRDQPEEQPEDIAQPELDLQPLAGIDVSIAKPKATFKAGGSFFRDGEYIPLFKVQPIYPRRAQERGTQGFAIVSFTITESGSVENAKAIEGYCGDPTGPESELRPCTMFNSASARAALKLKYKPKIVDGKATSVSDVLHRFTFIMAEDEGR